MPKETLSTQDLVSDARQNRYLQELSDHIEDSGDPAAIGNPVELADTFNAYARPKRTKRMAIVLLIGIASFFFSQIAMLSIAENSGSLNDLNPLFVQLSTIVGYIISFPVTVFILPLLFMGLVILKQDISNFLFAMVPFATCFLWAAIATFLLFSPYEIFKRNTKRRT